MIRNDKMHRFLTKGNAWGLENIPALWTNKKKKWRSISVSDLIHFFSGEAYKQQGERTGSHAPGGLNLMEPISLPFVLSLPPLSSLTNSTNK